MVQIGGDKAGFIQPNPGKEPKSEQTKFSETSIYIKMIEERSYLDADSTR